jgi:hypothetical protein
VAEHEADGNEGVDETDVDASMGASAKDGSGADSSGASGVDREAAGDRGGSGDVAADAEVSAGSPDAAKSSGPAGSPGATGATGERGAADVDGREPDAGAGGGADGDGAKVTGPQGAAEAVAAEGAAPGADGDAVDTPEFDEEAAWAAIVAGYGEEPPDPPGTKPFKRIEDLALLEPPDLNDDAPPGGEDAAEADRDPGKPKSGPAAGRPLGGSVIFAPGLGGPRDFTSPEPSEDDFDAEDEGHFVPPEPPPLPGADVTAKFAWLAVIGGPVLLFLAVVLNWDMTWWLTTLGVGGFVGGFVTLVVRMRTDDEDDEDPGRGAVV